MDFGVVAVLRPCFGFLSFVRSSGALNGWSLVNSICGMSVFFRFGSSGVGRSDSSSGGLRLLGFRAWSTGGRCLQGYRNLWGFFWLAVDLKKNKVIFPGFWGVVRVLHSLGVKVGWHFCPVEMGTGLRSLLALGWCLGGGNLGCGREAVATWRFGERSKKI